MQSEMQPEPVDNLADKAEWLHILKASRQAYQPGKLLLAAAGLVFTCLLGWVLDALWVSTGQGLTPAEVAETPMWVRLDLLDQQETGPFEIFISHEKYCLDHALKAARKFELTGMAGLVWWHRPEAQGPGALPTVGKGYGLMAFVIAMGRGMFWMLADHWFYFLIFALLTTAIWALCGGAICRISALQFARDERPPWQEALGYSRSKFLEFFLAPIIPIALVLMIGLSLYIGGLLMSIPYLGQIFSLLGGLLFGLVLLAGLLMALAIVGAVGGFSMMWPTVAVEGLDSTDAIGRSYSYFYERMERAVVYALLAIVYGALVWMVIKFGAFLLACGAHGFVSKGYPQLDKMWTTPTYDRLYDVPANADTIEGWAAKTVTFPFIRIWVSIAGFFLYGYLVSYYYTGSTIIYFLLRRRVDETELDDVYTAPSDELLPSASAAIPDEPEAAQQDAGDDEQPPEE